VIFDKNSATWLVFSSHLKEERLELLESLSATDLSERESDLIRGKIQMIDIVLVDIPQELEEVR